MDQSNRYTISLKLWSIFILSMQIEEGNWIRGYSIILFDWLLVLFCSVQEYIQQPLQQHDDRSHE